MRPAENYEDREVAEDVLRDWDFPGTRPPETHE